MSSVDPGVAHVGPGRPRIGNEVLVRLGDLLPCVDQWAAVEGVSRAEAIRRLIAAGLGAKYD